MLDALDALLVVGDLHVAHARLAAVHARAAELLLGDVLADGRAHEVRPGERHRAAALDHRHEVGQAGDVGGAGRARSHQRGDLRDHAAHHDLLAEQVPGAGEQRAGRLLHARAGGVEQPHERDALGQRQLAQARDLDLAGHAHRAGHHREVVGAHRGQAPVDLAVAGDHAVGRGVDAVHRALGEVRAPVHAQLDERAVVDQQRDALARGQLLALVLRGDLLLAAAEPDARSPLLEVLDERSQQRGGGLLCSHQRPFHSRLALLEERAHALHDVLGRLSERELCAQVVERVVERHVELAAHRVLAQAHDHRRLRRELAGPVGDRRRRARRRATTRLTIPASSACAALQRSPSSSSSLAFLRGTLR